MSTPTYYRSTDASAPSLTGDNAESLLGVLQACLVDGYGAQPGAGWTLAYTATGKRVFRNNPTTGSGCYVRVAVAAASNKFRIRAFATMSDIDTGAIGTGEAGLVTSVTTDATVRDWQLIADDQTLYFRAQGRTAAGPGWADGLGLMSAGDYDSDLGSAFNYMVWGMDTSNENACGMLDTSHCYGVGLTGSGSAASPDGLGSVGINFFRGPLGINGNNSDGIAGTGVQDFSETNQLIKVTPLVGGNAAGAWHLGKLRGCFFPCQDLATHYSIGGADTWDPIEVEPNLWFLFTVCEAAWGLQKSCAGVFVKTDLWP